MREFGTWARSVVLALAASVCIAAQPIGVGKGSYEFRSKRYQVTSDLPRQRAQELAAYMDLMSEQYERVLPGFNIKNSQPVRLYLFDTRNAYLELLAEKGFNARNTAGVFFSTHDGSGLAVFLEDQDRELIESTLRHEGFHQFATLRIGRNLPIWVNEGLAEYFGEGLLVRNQIRVGLSPWARLRSVQDAIEQKRVFSFDEFLRLDDHAWGEIVTAGDPRAPVMYDQAWSIVHFLMHADNGKYAGAFRAFVKACANGMQLEQALRSAFGTTDFTAFEAAWRRSIMAMEPDPMSAAVERLRFLAYGLRYLHEQNVRPESIDQLKEELRRHKFEMIQRTHSARRVLAASDDAYFQAPKPPKGAKPFSFVFVPTSSAGLPPTIVTQGLAVKAGIEWIQQPGSELDFRVTVR